MRYHTNSFSWIEFDWTLRDFLSTLISSNSCFEQLKLFLCDDSLNHVCYTLWQTCTNLRLKTLNCPLPLANTSLTNTVSRKTLKNIFPFLKNARISSIMFSAILLQEWSSKIMSLIHVLYRVCIQTDSNANVLKWNAN